ncbi:MAG: hypothetical protein KIH67_003710 [Candidatus Moranbacteria bacterium]|nr:hypothetical protein [Candidatus Moranbacteria bacterium]
MTYSFHNIVAKVTVLKQDIGEVWNAYLNIDEEDTKEEKVEKVEDVVSASLSYFIHDWWMAIVFGALMVALNALHLHFGWIFLFGWVYDIICAVYFVILDHKKGIDLTLGSNTRRSLDVLKTKSRPIWILVLSGIFSKAAVWDGPERVVMIFRKELNTWWRVSVIVMLLAALQAAFWQAFWTWGYETVEGDADPRYMLGALSLWYVLAVKRYFSRSGWGETSSN